ncbi:hypothetical protein [Kozakia baliensis]|uniref:hypothetical protein n=1 Tax=Kozakia baliensis TaxID=153496 RepID=UPI00049535E7|nr:hypothetical protein [Kozakia baliensis]
MRDISKALRLYVSPVFFRENVTVYAGVVYLLLCAGMDYTYWGRNFWHDGRYTMPGLLATFWWLSLQAWFTALSTHYWRQVRSPATFMLPRLQAAEYGAAHIVLPLLFVVLALPILSLGAPLLNVMALESINVVIWSGSDRVGPRNMRTRMRVPRLVLNLGAFIVLLAPSMQSRLLSAPWYVAAAILLVTIPMALQEYRFRSYVMANETPVKARRARKNRTPSRWVMSIVQMIMWQPSWLRRVPFPNSFSTGAPLGLGVQIILMAAAFGLLMMLAACLSEMKPPSWDMLKHAMRSASVQTVILNALGLVGWMRSRQDWPFLLSLGPFGSRTDFSYAVFRAHGLRTMQAAVILGVFFGAMMWRVGQAHAGLALAEGLACAAMLVGASYLPSIAFLFRKSDRPGLIMLLSFGGIMMLVQFYLDWLIEARHTTWWMWVPPIGALAFAAVMARIAPPALGQKDWLIEPPAG